VKAALQTFDEVFDVSLRLIARRALTRRELRQRLKRKGAPDKLIDEVVRLLTSDGYIDERAIAEDVIQHGRDEKLVGRFFLRHELRARGIDEMLIDKVLAKEYPEKTEKQVAHNFIEKKLLRLQTTSSNESNVSPKLEKSAIQKLAAALDRRGFSADVISDIVHSLNRL